MMVDLEAVPSRVRVLIALDLLFATLVKQSLEREGDIDVVGIVDEVVSVELALKEEEIDVVLTAFDLHGGNAIDVIKIAQDTRPETKVIILTAWRGRQQLRTAIDAGAAGFLTVSQRPEDIARGIRAANGGDVPVDPSVLKLLLSSAKSSRPMAGSVLTARESEVLELMATGLSISEIAEELRLSVNTIRNHSQRILEKLGAHSKLQAVVIARRDGLVSG
jgi:DNA-binding NarL/FixJ family response regulator